MLTNFNQRSRYLLDLLIRLSYTQASMVKNRSRTQISHYSLERYSPYIYKELAKLIYYEAFDKDGVIIHQGDTLSNEVLLHHIW